jgi:hypothetical protein
LAHPTATCSACHSFPHQRKQYSVMINNSVKYRVLLKQPDP